MKKLNIFNLIPVLMLTLLCSFVVAQDDDDDLGTDKLAQTGMKFLSFSPDARAAALGDAITAKTGGASSLFYNPAGMARLEGMNVAVGQTQTKTASPLNVIFNKKNKTNWDAIIEIIEEWKPELILIGMPLNMDGTDSEIMKRVVNFKKKLKNISSVKCEFIDERLTTFEARLEVKDLNIKTVDSHAAKILIENWFNIEK